MTITRLWNGRGGRKRAGALVAAGMAFTLTTSSVSAAGVGHYSFTANSGSTYGLQSAGNLVNGFVDDQLFYLSTTSSGLNRLPFALKFYNHTFRQIAISSNGNIQLGIGTGGGSTAYTNECLPSSSIPGYAVMPFWDDLVEDSNDTGHFFTEGVFVKTKGSAPHRSFTVAWQGHEFSASGVFVLAQATFKEGSQTITMVYGANGGDSATIGVQASSGQAFTQYACNSGLTNTVISGLKLTALHSA